MARNPQSHIVNEAVRRCRPLLTKRDDIIKAGNAIHPEDGQPYWENIIIYHPKYLDEPIQQQATAEIQPILVKIQNPDSDPEQKAAFKELENWKKTYFNEEVRQRAIDDAAKAILKQTHKAETDIIKLLSALAIKDPQTRQEQTLAAAEAVFGERHPDSDNLYRKPHPARQYQYTDTLLPADVIIDNAAIMLEIEYADCNPNMSRKSLQGQKHKAQKFILDVMEAIEPQKHEHVFVKSYITIPPSVQHALGYPPASNEIDSNPWWRYLQDFEGHMKRKPAVMVGQPIATDLAALAMTHDDVCLGRNRQAIKSAVGQAMGDDLTQMLMPQDVSLRQGWQPAKGNRILFDKVQFDMPPKGDKGR